MPDPDLYGLPLEEFTSSRDKAAREIRKTGDRETATRIAKLPKPTPAAWTANQVAREQPELIDALLEAGAALRDAQDAALSGSGAGGLREATLAERRAVDAVMSAAVALRPAGKPLSRPMADRLRTTLHAAAGDSAIRDALAAGRLVSEAQAGGAWPFAVADEPAPEPRAAKGGAKRRAAATEDDTGAGGERRATKARGKAKDEEAAARKAAERERAAAERKALEEQLREARGSLRVRERAAKAAEADAEATARAVEKTREKLVAAQRAAQDAQDDAEAAERVVVEARTALQGARDDVARLEEELD